MTSRQTLTLALFLGALIPPSASLAAGDGAAAFTPPAQPIPYGQVDSYLGATPKDRIAHGWQVSPPLPPIPANIAAAVASPDRTPAEVARDNGRAPAEILAMAGVKTGDKVIEIGSFGNYDSKMLSVAVGPAGHVYMYDLPYNQARYEAPTKLFMTTHANTEYKIGDFDKIDFPKGVDLATIDMYYHDMTLNKIDPKIVDAKLFAALKPGGRLLIVDHNAPPGSGRQYDINTVHRIDPKVIVAEVTAAGFKLIINSNIFANPNDDRTKMIYSPGERGATDRSVFVFQKPK